jgi:predicted histidine transporter YuiF (NhaC family)
MTRTLCYALAAAMMIAMAAGMGSAEDPASTGTLHASATLNR